jgi:hypothetical protein
MVTAFRIRSCHAAGINDSLHNPILYVDNLTSTA